MDHRSAWLPPLGRRAWLALGMNMLACMGSGLTMPFLILYLHLARGFSLPAPVSCWVRRAARYMSANVAYESAPC